MEWPTASLKAAFSRHENVVRQPVALKGVAQQVLALTVDVASSWLGSMDMTYSHEVQIAERHAGLETS